MISPCKSSCLVPGVCSRIWNAYTCQGGWSRSHAQAAQQPCADPVMECRDIPCVGLWAGRGQGCPSHCRAQLGGPGPPCGVATGVCTEELK